MRTGTVVLTVQDAVSSFLFLAGGRRRGAAGFWCREGWGTAGAAVGGLGPGREKGRCLKTGAIVNMVPPST